VVIAVLLAVVGHKKKKKKEEEEEEEKKKKADTALLYGTDMIWKLKEEAPDRTLRSKIFGTGCGLVKQAMER
jgi:hypothetical protein